METYLLSYFGLFTIAYRTTLKLIITFLDFGMVSSHSLSLSVSLSDQTLNIFLFRIPCESFRRMALECLQRFRSRYRNGRHRAEF